MIKELLGMYKMVGLGLVLAAFLLILSLGLAALLGPMRSMGITIVVVALGAPPLVLWATNKIMKNNDE